MDPDSTPESSSSADVSTAGSSQDLARQFRALRDLVNLGLVGMIILASSYAYLMYHEIGVAARQVRQTATQVVAFEKEIAPKLKEVASKLEAYSKLRPQFAPIYNKYFGTNTQDAATVTGSAPPAALP